VKIRIDVFGTPRCLVEDRELADLPAQRTRFALLLYLVVERVVARDKVAAVFWPDSNDERARHALSQSLYELKRLLGETWIGSQGGKLTVTNDVSTDLAEFTLCAKTDLESALHLYRGNFLSGFFLPNCKEFETWVDQNRGHYERLHRKIRREYVELLISQSKLDEAVEAARAWTVIDPLDDEANHRLVELLGHRGARADALAAYAAYEQRLKDELDVVPLDHTKELIRNLRDNPGVGAPTPLPPNNNLPDPSLRPLPTIPHIERRWTWRWVGISAAVMTTILVVVLDLGSIVTTGNVQLSPRWSMWLGGPKALDDSHYVVLPFTYAQNMRVRLNEDYILHDVLSRWDGISVVPPFQVREAVARQSGSTTRDNLRTVRMLGAGRYIMGEVATFADSVRVHAVVYNSHNGQPINDRSVRLAPNLANASEALRRLGDQLLFQGGRPEKGTSGPIGTTSLVARRSFVDGQSAVGEWQLAVADSAFAIATRADPNYTQAFLWLAQTRAWSRSSKDEWKYAADHAAALQSTLSARDKILARAVAALAADDYPKACALYREYTDVEPEGFTGWYGLADCLNRDVAVVRDQTSPTGFKFRSSYAEAFSAYRRAFQIMPSIHKALHARSFHRLRTLLFTNSRHQRFGESVDDTTTFRAYPSWHGDSLAFIPVRAVDALKPVNRFDVARTEDAVKHQRRLFHEIAASWAAAFPASPEALEAIAVAMEMLGNPAAIDSIRRARSMSVDSEQRTRLAVNEVVLQIKFALPNDLRGLRRARAIADSILKREPPATTKLPIPMSSLAVLLGKADLAARYHQNYLNVSQRRALPEIGRLALSMEVYASLGGPRDTIMALERRLNEAIANNIATSEQQATRAEALLRIAPLALPTVALASLPQLLIEEYPALTMAAAATRRDVLTVRATQRNTLDRRSRLRAADISLDAVFPEAWSLMTVGDLREAINWIDPTLNSIRFSGPGLYATDPVEAASLVRTIALRADLANAIGDVQTRRRWAAIISILWSDCDNFLKPTLQRMKVFAGS
jgi:DNA-binding SARP family transcriptional activator